MHPIERLRFVARAEGVDDRLIALEATAALVSFEGDPAALVAACRRVLSRQPRCGPLWWACARLLTAEDLWATAQETIAMIEADPSRDALAYALSELSDDPGAPVPRVREACALGRGHALLGARDPLGGTMAADPRGNAPAWLLAPVGTHLADPMWDALVAASSAEADLVELADFTHVVGPSGPVPVAALGRPDCAVAPELASLRG